MPASQSKTFWSFLILVDVLLLVAFGWALADRLYTVLEEPLVSVQPANLPKAKPAKAATTAPAGPAAPAAPDPAQATAVRREAPAKTPERTAAKTPQTSKAAPAKGASEPAVVKAKKVVFLYKNKNAKKVLIEGTFTKWASRPMEKNKGEWRYTAYLLPGYEYPYRFVVDGKIITDPSNPREKWGKSLMPVK